jgi:hypothetical protein
MHDGTIPDSPIRGWLRNASNQSESAKARHVSSDAASKAASSETGLLLAIPLAHAREPQHGSISSTAASKGRKFQRASTAVTLSSRFRRAAEEIPQPDSPPRLPGTSP